MNAFARWLHSKEPRKKLRRLKLAITEPYFRARLQLLRFKRIDDLNKYERKICSQNGEDGIIRAVFAKLGTTDRFCVEFGVQKGTECNTRYLRERLGWGFLWMDGRKDTLEPIKREFITAENVNSIFAKYRVPKTFDLLSIDIDGNDYWVWKALEGYRPRVVVIEYNGSIPPTESKVIPYDPNQVWDRTDYGGASILALAKLGELKGYTLVCCDGNGVNAFFVRSDLVQGRIAARSVEAIYRRSVFRGLTRYAGHREGPYVQV